MAEHQRNRPKDKEIQARICIFWYPYTFETMKQTFLFSKNEKRFAPLWVDVMIIFGEKCWRFIRN
jgi:hypothetical protein